MKHLSNIEGFIMGIIEENRELIKGMEEPTILMHEKYFDLFKKQVESKVTNLQVGAKPFFENIPIKTSILINEYEVILYDNKNLNC